MPKSSSRYPTGLSLIKSMSLLALLGLALLAALSLFKKEAAPAVTFNTLSGEHITTASLHGKVVLVNFWATSCSTCVQEMPRIGVCCGSDEL